MKLFKRNQDKHMQMSGTYDSDDDSIPPPPPPPQQGPTPTMDGQASVISSVKTSNEEFYDTPNAGSNVSVTPSMSSYNNRNVNMEHSRLVKNPTNDEHNGVPTSSAEEAQAQKRGYSQVPMTGHFRGMKKAQSYDEEEAGMDEIEVRNVFYDIITIRYSRTNIIVIIIVLGSIFECR